MVCKNDYKSNFYKLYLYWTTPTYSLTLLSHKGTSVGRRWEIPYPLPRKRNTEPFNRLLIGQIGRAHTFLYVTKSPRWPCLIQVVIVASLFSPYTCCDVLAPMHPPFWNSILLAFATKWWWCKNRWCYSKRSQVSVSSNQTFGTYFCKTSRSACVSP